MFGKVFCSKGGTQGDRYFPRWQWKRCAAATTQLRNSLHGLDYGIFCGSVCSSTLESEVIGPSSCSSHGSCVLPTLTKTLFSRATSNTKTAGYPTEIDDFYFMLKCYLRSSCYSWWWLWCLEPPKWDRKLETKMISCSSIVAQSTAPPSALTTIVLKHKGQVQTLLLLHTIIALVIYLAHSSIWTLQCNFAVDFSTTVICRSLISRINILLSMEG